MYSVVLAAVLTTGTATPDWHKSFGCQGCSGCTGCVGCHGCYGCGGGCYGCGGGCYGCYGCYGCAGSYAVSSYNFYSCSGCGGCWGCGGSRAGVPVQVEVPKAPKPKPATSTAKPATILVKADAGARMTVNEQPVDLRGTQESFTTPTLEPAQSYLYVFKAESMVDGKPATRIVKAYVAAGEETRVDLRAQAAKGATAKVSVTLPEGTRLYVDDVPYPATQEKITFETPQLDAERTYFYTLKAERVRDGKVYRDSRRVDVAAGKEVTVEFKDLPTVQAVQR
jgi:uncharacterized protein (TIGR03000 family)